MLPLPPLAATALLLASVAAQEPAQDPGAPQGPAPQIQWQRSLADALAVQQATGLPLLLCVNMDGEVFCDRFATTTYRDPAFVALTEGYVCLVASPDRHNEMDYDGAGRRLECPRFPGCTCSEHQNVEPLLFERWFGGRRNAPRHVGVGPDGKVLFDRYMDASMQTAIDAIAQHKGSGELPAPPGSTVELLQRRDAAARRALESSYAMAGAKTRLAILAAAAKGTNEPFDVLRMALRDDDPAVFAGGAEALAATATKDALIDLEDALARADAPLQQVLRAAITRLAATVPAARRLAAHLAAVDEGIAVRTREPFRSAFAAPVAPPPLDRDVLDGEVADAEQACKQAPDDGKLRLRFATANFLLAEAHAATGSNLAAMLYADAARAAARAGQKLTDAAKKAAAEAIQAYAMLAAGSDGARQHGRAALALAIAGGGDCDPTGRPFARGMQALAQSATTAVYEAAKQDANALCADAVKDAAAAWAILSDHPAATDKEAIQGAQLFAFTGARRVARDLLERALARWPWSRDLHQAFRERVLPDCGAEGLRAAYARYADGAADAGTAQWFAGYAAIVAAEVHVRDRRPDQALAAYGDCIDRFAKSAEANADNKDSAGHFAVLAHVGRALLRHEAGLAEKAVDELRAAAALRPASLAEADGLGRKGRAVAARIEQALRKQGRQELADQLAPVLGAGK
jgi:hypothetical protein